MEMDFYIERIGCKRVKVKKKQDYDSNEMQRKEKERQGKKHKWENILRRKIQRKPDLFVDLV